MRRHADDLAQRHVIVLQVRLLCGERLQLSLREGQDLRLQERDLLIILCDEGLVAAVELLPFGRRDILIVAHHRVFFHKFHDLAHRLIEPERLEQHLCALAQTPRVGRQAVIHLHHLRDVRIPGLP